MKEPLQNGRVKTIAADANDVAQIPVGRPLAPPAGDRDSPPRKSSVAKVSHTLSVALAERLEAFAFFQRVSESAVIEHALTKFFGQSDDDSVLGDLLRREGAGRRRKT
jgi:hypothetical protein